MDDKFLFPAEAAAALHTSPASIRRWIRAGRLECAERMANGTRLIKTSEVKRLLRQQIAKVGKTK